MPISVTCPHCAAPLKAPDERAGRRAKCLKCGQKLTVPGPQLSAESSGELAPILEDDDFAFRPDAPTWAAPASGKYRPKQAENPGMKLAVGAVIAGGCILAVIGGYVLWKRFGPAAVSATTPATQNERPPAELPKKSDSPQKPDPAQKSGVSDTGVPLNLNNEGIGGKRRNKRGPALPTAPAGKTFVARADAAVSLPVSAAKIHTLLVSPPGSTGVAIHRSFDGFAGKGAIDTVERFAIPSGVAAGKREIPADGVPPGRVAALAPDGSRLVVEGPPGTLAVWHLDKETDQSPESTVVPFAPESGKPVPVVAIYYLKDDRVVAVGSQGQVAVYDVAKKEKVVEAGSVSEKLASEPLSVGKSLAITGDGRTLVMVLGGKVYEVAANSGKVISSTTAVPKGATIRAVAADPAGVRVLVAFTDETGGRIALYPLGADKPKVAVYFPDELGDPASAQWLGDNCVLLAGTKGSGFVVFDAEVGKWVAYVRTPPTTGVHVRGTDRAYHLVPAGEGKAKLVAVEWPFDDYFKERDVAVNTKSIAAYVLTAEGLTR